MFNCIYRTDTVVHFLLLHILSNVFCWFAWAWFLDNLSDQQSVNLETIRFTNNLQVKVCFTIYINIISFLTNCHAHLCVDDNIALYLLWSADLQHSLNVLQAALVCMHLKLSLCCSLEQEIICISAVQGSWVAESKNITT